MCKQFSFLFFGLSLVLSSCERSGHENAEETVTWPEIADFDNLAFQADGLVRVKDFEAVRDLHADLVKAGMAVTPSSIPANAAKPKEVELILSDLSNLVSGLQADPLDDSSMENLVLGLHPVIAKLIEAAGMPHIHANEGPNGGFLFPLFDSNRNRRVPLKSNFTMTLETSKFGLKVVDTRGILGGYQPTPILPSIFPHSTKV
jgi:hypothetical protein